MSRMVLAPIVLYFIAAWVDKHLEFGFLTSETVLEVDYFPNH